MSESKTTTTEDARPDRPHPPDGFVIPPDEVARTAEYEEIFTRVKTLLIEQLHLRREPDEIDPDSALFATGLGFDSVDAVELTVTIENAFGVKIPDDERSRTIFRTVNSLVNHLLTTKEAAHVS